MASVLDRPDRIVISTSVHQAGKTSKCGPEKIKKLTQDVWKGEYCAPVRWSGREAWDILIGGECAAETVLPWLVGPCPAGSWMESGGKKHWEVLRLGPGKNDGSPGKKMLGVKADPLGCPDP